MSIEIGKISLKQYEQYKKGEEIPEINEFFNLILKSLPENLREEASDKGFILEENGFSMGILALNVVVPNASEKLKYRISDYTIFCYFD